MFILLTGFTVKLRRGSLPTTNTKTTTPNRMGRLHTKGMTDCLGASANYVNSAKQGSKREKQKTINSTHTK